MSQPRRSYKDHPFVNFPAKSSSTAPASESPSGSSQLSTTRAPTLSTSSSAANVGREKRSLPPPITLSQFGLMALLTMCRRYLFIDMRYKLTWYAALVLIGSFVAQYFPPPRSFYISKKSNMFNIVFVKWGLAWTLAVLFAFIYASANVYCLANWRRIKQQLARLVVVVAVWFVCTRMFVHVEKTTGFCSTRPDLASREACETAAPKGARWIAFDISGHCFLLIYCALVIAEEARAFRRWARIGELLTRRIGRDDVSTPELAAMSDAELTLAKRLFDENLGAVRFSFVLCAALAMLWDVMLVVTVLYYHSLAQKFAGAFIAIACWFLTYRCWYRLDLSPGMPGRSKIKYQTVLGQD